MMKILCIWSVFVNFSVFFVCMFSVCGQNPPYFPVFLINIFTHSSFRERGSRNLNSLLFFIFFSTRSKPDDFKFQDSPFFWGLGSTWGDPPNLVKLGVIPIWVNFFSDFSVFGRLIHPFIDLHKCNTYIQQNE